METSLPTPMTGRVELLVYWRVCCTLGAGESMVRIFSKISSRFWGTANLPNPPVLEDFENLHYTIYPCTWTAMGQSEIHNTGSFWNPQDKKIDISNTSWGLHKSTFLGGCINRWKYILSAASTWYGICVSSTRKYSGIWWQRFHSWVVCLSLD